MIETQKTTIRLHPATIKVLDAIENQGSAQHSRAYWIEKLLWRHPLFKQVAAELSIEAPTRRLAKTGREVQL